MRWRPIANRPEEDEAPEARGPADPSDPSDRREPPTQKQIHEEVAKDILRIHEESYGKGARHSQAFVMDDWVIVVLDDIELLPNEQFLLDNGDADTVSQVRTRYQQAIQTTFCAAIERATGRTVVGFASANSVEEPRFMAEIFKLG